MTPVFYYQAVVAVLAVMLLGNALINAITFRRPRASRIAHADSDLPFISILVPARNEEENIEDCLRSLLALNYPHFEVLALDDGSTDSTYSILCRLRDQDYKLRVLVGSTLPDGWYGKPHACWQLANAAKGEYLLMTDADCIFSTDALLLALGAAEEHGADVVSLSPDLIAESFWERLIIPLQYMIVYAFLPTALVRKTKHPWFSAANGAFLFMRRETYFAIDGHRAVRQQLAEDIKFAQHVKRSGKTLWYGDGSRVYSVRMYETLSGIWAGFSKNIFPAFSKNAPLLAAVLLFLLMVLVLPLFFAVAGVLAHKAWAWLAVSAYLSALAIRTGISLRYGHDTVIEMLLFPLGWAVVIGIAVNSTVESLSGRGNSWKGRQYGA
jgi:chlorobactene glucosyltransferase